MPPRPLPRRPRPGCLQPTPPRSSRPRRRRWPRRRRRRAPSRRSTRRSPCTTWRPPTRSSIRASAGRRRPCSRGRPTAPATRCATATRRPPRSPAPRASTSASSGSTRRASATHRSSTTPTPMASPTTSSCCLQIAEYSYGVEVGARAAGWEPPKRDLTGCGANPGTHSDIYLKQLGNRGLFGYQSVDPGQGRARSQYGYMVLDDDYARSEYGYDDPAIPRQRHLRPRVQPPAAGRLRHLPGPLDEGVDRDLGGGEGVPRRRRLRRLPAVLRQVPRRADYGDLPPGCHQVLADLRRRRLEPLARRRRRRLRRRTPSAEPGSSPTSPNPPTSRSSAYDRSIERDGGKSFSREFAAFAAATAEWRSGFGGFPDHARVSRTSAARARWRRAASSGSSSTTPPIAC